MLSVAASLPAEQWTHPACPLLGWRKLSCQRHRTQAVARPALVYEPPPHWLQEGGAPSTENVPAAQGMHPRSATVYSPAMHPPSVHGAVAPTLSEYFPLAQLLHAVVPTAVEYVPAGHAPQSAEVPLPA